MRVILCILFGAIAIGENEFANLAEQILHPCFDNDGRSMLRSFLRCCCETNTTVIGYCVQRHNGCCSRLAHVCPKQYGISRLNYTNPVLSISHRWTGQPLAIWIRAVEPYDPSEIPFLCTAVKRIFTLVPGGEIPIRTLLTRAWTPTRADGTDPTRFYPSKEQLVWDLYSQSTRSPYAGITVSADRHKIFDGVGSNAYFSGAQIRDKIISLLDGEAVRLIVEVGSFIGSGAVGSWGKIAREFDGVVICVDTWQGDVTVRLLDLWRPNVNITSGFPQLGPIFMERMVAEGMQDVVFPLPMNSVAASRMLFLLGYRIDIVYLDASHEPGETIAELHLYWQLLRPGGLLMGDDLYTFPAVRADVNLFLACYNVTIESFAQDQWVIRKPTKVVAL